MLKPKTLFYDGYEHINRNRYPYLGLHCVLRGSVETLDSQVLLDPFEEQLDMPAIPIQFANGNGRKREIVCNESEGLITLLIPILHYSQGVWEISGAFWTYEFGCPVADKPRGTVHRAIVGATVLGVLFGSQNKEAQ